LAKSRKNHFAQTPADAKIKDFLDMVSPSVIQFNVDHYLCGNTYRCVWALREYPTATDEQAICAANGLEQETPLPSGLLLIPRVR
jgi:hypothetical protein